MSKEDLTATIARVLAKAPQWVRHDLGAADTSVRTRAEDTLAAMIADALTQKGAHGEG